MSNKLICKDVLNNSNIKFGTSGARGLVEDFSPEVTAAFIHAFLFRISECFKTDTLFIGIDNRPSSYSIAEMCASAAYVFGYKVRYFGVLPTPALAAYSIENQQPSIMVTGSHIPFDRNGLKFYTPVGEITKNDENAIIESDIEFSLDVLNQPMESDIAAVNYYKKRNSALLSDNALGGLKIGLYEHSSAGRDIYKSILESFGANVVSIGRSNEFIPIDTEAVSVEDKRKAKQWVDEFELDAIFSTDGDGDRPLIADEKGNWFRGDVVGLLTCMELNIEGIAVPVSCNTAIELSNAAKKIVRTKIGSPYVIAQFPELLESHDTVAGFEANGGFMLGAKCSYNGNDLAPLATRDALLPFIVLMARSVRTNKSLSRLSDELPSRFTASDRLQNIPTSLSREFIAEAESDAIALLYKLGLDSRAVIDSNTTDGFRVKLDNQEIVHLRPSGNAPELRVYVEASSEERANELVGLILVNLKRVLGL